MIKDSSKKDKVKIELDKMLEKQREKLLLNPVIQEKKLDSDKKDNVGVLVMKGGKETGSLYWGNEKVALNETWLKEHGVQCIVNVSENKYLLDHYLYLNISVLDSNKTKIGTHFDSAFKFLSESISKGKSALVFCKGGSRSVAIIISFLLKFKKKSIKKDY